MLGGECLGVYALGELPLTTTPSEPEPGETPFARRGMGPGWKLFGHHTDGYHPPIARRPRAREVEQDVVSAYRTAMGEPSPDAVFEIDRAADEALSVATGIEDGELRDMAARILELRKLELGVEAYLARVGEILRAEEDDMEALDLIARLI